MKKRILSVLLGCSLLVGTVFTNAVSIEFEEIDDCGTDNVINVYAEKTENSNSPLATEIEEYNLQNEVLILKMKKIKVWLYMKI